MNKLLYIAIASFLLVSCKTSGYIQKSDAPVSAADYPYIDAFHKGMQYKVQGRVEEAILEFEKCLQIRTDDDAVYYALSKLELERGNAPASANYIRKANEIDPDNTWYIEELAYMYIENQEFEQAAKYFKQLVDKEPRNIDWQYAYSEALLRNGQNKEALEVFKTMEAQVGKHPHFALKRYDILMKAGDKSGAEAALLVAKSEFPKDPSIIGSLVDHYYQTRQNDKAEKFLIELVEADPENGRAQLALADIYLRRGAEKKAYVALQKAVESPGLDIDTKMNVLISIQEQSSEIPQEMFPIVDAFVTMYPDSAKAHSIQGDYLIVAGENEKARTSYEKAVSLDNSLFPIWNQVMILQYESNDYEALYASSKECLELFPAASTVYLLQGISANETGRHGEAVDALSLGMELIVNDPSLKAEFLGQLGEAYFHQKEYTEAFDNYKKALNLDARNASIKNNYARRLAMLNRDLELAESLAEQIVSSYPDESIFIDTKGLVNFYKENYKEAEKLFLKALENDENNPLILEHLGDAQFKQGKKSAAVSSWKLARENGSVSKNIDRKIADKKYYEMEL